MTHQIHKKPGFYFPTRALCSLVFWIFLDQWTKHKMRMLALHNTITILPFLKFSGVWNSGISFGLFPCNSSLQKIILWGMSTLMIIFLIRQYISSSKKVPRLGILLMISGACGNLWDRIFYGKVFDFISIRFGRWDFPVFNLADMLISVGFLLSAISSFSQEKDD